MTNKHIARTVLAIIVALLTLPVVAQQAVTVFVQRPNSVPEVWPTTAGVPQVVCTNCGGGAPATPQYLVVTDPATPTSQMSVTPDGSGVVTIRPNINEGCTPYHKANGTAASTNSTSIKTGQAVVCILSAINTTSTLYYLKVYDSAGAPTCSSATGLKHVFPIPHATGAGNGFVFPISMNEVYVNGIGFCVTGGGSDTDNTNAATGVWIEGSYK